MDIRWYNIFSYSFDAVLGSIVMLLMMERYNESYLKLVSILDRCKLFCCCTRFVERYVLGKMERTGHIQCVSNVSNSNTINMNANSTPTDQDRDDTVTVDTKTIVPVLNRHNTFDDCEKEYTVNTVKIDLE